MLNTILRRSFCKAKQYIEKFSALQKDVNDKQAKYLSRLKYLQRLQKHITSLGQLPLLNNIKYKFLQNPLTSLQKQLSQRLQSNNKTIDEMLKKNQIQKKQQTKKAQFNFLNSLAKFSINYSQQLSKLPLKNQVKQGLELSAKSLESILQKQGITWIQDKSVKFSDSIHERQNMSDKGVIIQQILQKGYKINEKTIQKAKVKTKQQ